MRPAAERPYVRLRPLAYVTGRGPHGGIGSPPGRGAEAYRMGSGHMSAPDPSLVLHQGLSFSCLGIPRPYRGRSGPHVGGVRTPSHGPDLHTWWSRTSPGGPGCIHRGPPLSHGVYRLLWPCGGPGATHVEGSGVVHRATRDSHAGTVPSYCSKGYPCFRVPTICIVCFHIIVVR